jgi:hypothetical protein
MSTAAAPVAPAATASKPQAWDASFIDRYDNVLFDCDGKLKLACEKERSHSDASFPPLVL